MRVSTAICWFVVVMVSVANAVVGECIHLDNGATTKARRGPTLV